MSEDDIRLTDIIYCDDLLRRWPGVSEDELAAIIKGHTLPCYTQHKRLKAPDGQEISFCTKGGKPWGQWQGEIAYYDWGSIVFETADVERFEIDRPELKWPIIKDEEQMPHQDQWECEKEWINCDTLAARWGWSPFDVVELLDSGVLRYNIHFGSWWEPLVSNLRGISVHIIDLQAWETENAEKIHNAPVLVADGGRLRAENNTLAARVTELEEQNSILRTELKTECAKLVRTGPPAHLEKAKKEKTAERWKNHLRSGLTLAVHIIKEDKTFTADELREKCRSLGLPALGEDALKIFRETMPPKYINTGGRPPKK